MPTKNLTAPGLKLTAPYTVCDACGAVPALYFPNGYEECPACHTERVMLEAAEDHLRALLAPALAAWAWHWEAAGMSRAQLQESLALMINRAQITGRTSVIDEARAAHPVPGSSD